MRLFLYEAYKVFSKPFILIAVLVVLVLNAGLQMNIPDESRQVHAVYQSMQDLSNEEKLTVLDATISEIDALFEIAFESTIGEDNMNILLPDALSNYYPMRVYLQVRDEIHSALNHNVFISDVVLQADTIDDFSLFSNPDSFDYKNTKLAASVYQELRDTPIEVQSSIALERSLSSITTVFLTLMLTVLFAVSLGSMDAETEVIWLLKSTKKGRSHRIAAQIHLLFLFSLLLNLLILLSSLFANRSEVGLGNLFSPIQSISMFYTSPLKVNILTYLFIHFGLNVMAVFLCAILTLYITTRLGQAMLSFFAALIVLASQYFLHLRIASNSNLNIFKYINLFSAMDSKTLFSSFKTLNVFNTPIQIPLILLILFGLSLFLLYLLLLKQSVHSKQWNNKKLTLPKRKKSYQTSLFLNEAYKLLFTNKVIYVFILLLVYGLISGVTYSDSLDRRDFLYKKYITTTNGYVNEETDRFIRSEEERYERISQNRIQLAAQYEKKELAKEDYMLAVSALDTWVDYEMAFNQFKSEVERAKELGLTTVVYKTGYEKIIGDQARANYLFLNVIASIFLVLSLAPFYAYDNSRGMSKIITPTVNGRMVLLKKKCLIASLISLAITLITTLSYFFAVLKFYGYTQLNANINTIISFPLSIPIWLYLIGIVVLLALVYAICSIVILFISMHSKRAITAIGLSGLLFILPALLLYLGIRP